MVALLLFLLLGLLGLTLRVFILFIDRVLAASLVIFLVLLLLILFPFFFLLLSLFVKLLVLEVARYNVQLQHDEHQANQEQKDRDSIVKLTARELYISHDRLVIDVDEAADVNELDVDLALLDQIQIRIVHEE